MSNPSHITELDLVVGSLITTHPDEDHAEFEEERDTISIIQDQLHDKGIVADLLAQPGVEAWSSGIETLGSLYQLSRMAVRLERNKDIIQVLEDGPVIYDDLDSAVTKVWDNLTTTRFTHLVNLQGINSYYLPVDFEQPLWLPFENAEGESDEAFFGSSVRLYRELTDLSTLLDQADIAPSAAAYQCLKVLRDAAANSLHSGLPIIVW